MTRTELEELVGAISSAKEALDELCTSYSRLPSVLDLETRAIGAGNIQDLESAKESKADLAASVEAAVLHLKSVGPVIARYAAKLGVAGSDQSRPTMSEIAVLVSRIAESGKLPALEAQLAKHFANGMTERVSWMVTNRKSTQPLVEKNQYLIQRALARNTESLRFWQELRRDFLSGYDASGVQQNKGRSSSVLNIKA